MSIVGANGDAQPHWETKALWRSQSGVDLKPPQAAVVKVRPQTKNFASSKIAAGWSLHRHALNFAVVVLNELSGNDVADRPGAKPAASPRRQQ
jgi:hypothetical protein